MERRLLLAAPALLLAGRAMAQGAPPAAPAFAPAFHRFALGDWQVTTLFDGAVRRPNALQGLVVNAPAPAVQAALDESVLPAQGLPNPYVVTMLRTPRGVVAFDAGTGAGQMAPGTGLLPRSMEAAGIRPEEVVLVVVSHFHGDHITGLTTREDQPFFPNAQVAVPEPEWAWWSDEANRSRSPEFQRGNFANVARRFAPLRERLVVFRADGEVAPGIRAIPTPGHTPGHTSFHVANGNAGLYVTADAAGRPELFLRHPGWHSVFDFDGPLATQSRNALFGRIADERARLCAYHFNFPGTGHIARAGDGFRFLAADWNA